MKEIWAKIPGFKQYEISNLGEIAKLGKTKRIPIKVSTQGNFVYASLSYEPHKSKQVNVRAILDQCFEDHIFKDHSIDDLEGEVWRDVVGWKSAYEVSNLGRIRSKERLKPSKNGSESRIAPKIKETYLDEDGYERVSLYYNRETKLLGVHRIVAEAFIPNPDNLPQVNHKNSNKSDNRVENLEWCTNTQNIRHSIQEGTRQPDLYSRPVLRLEDNKRFASIAELHRELNINYNKLVHILKSSKGKPVWIEGQTYKYEVK